MEQGQPQFRKLPVKVRRRKGRAKPASVTISSTGRSELNSEASAFLREAGTARGITMEVANVDVYLSEDGRLLCVVPTKDTQAVRAKLLKGRGTFTMDLGALMEELRVPGDTDFSFVCPVRLERHPDLGLCLIIYLGEELTRLRARRRPESQPQNEQQKAAAQAAAAKQEEKE